MKIEFDEEKRRKILEERGVDMAKAGLVFQGPYVQIDDDRKDYGEKRYRVWGHLDGQRVHFVWTPRGDSRRIITMYPTHEREHQARLRTLE